VILLRTVNPVNRLPCLPKCNVDSCALRSDSVTLLSCSSNICSNICIVYNVSANYSCEDYHLIGLLFILMINKNIQGWVIQRWSLGGWRAAASWLLPYTTCLVFVFSAQRLPQKIKCVWFPLYKMKSLFKTKPTLVPLRNHKGTDTVESVQRGAQDHCIRENEYYYI